MKKITGGLFVFSVVGAVLSFCNSLYYLGTFCTIVSLISIVAFIIMAKDGD